MKQYIGITRDHSGSMRSIRRAAMDDFNQNVATIQTAAVREGIDTIVSVVECGATYEGIVRRAVVNSGVSMLKKLTTYETDGRQTPLFDSVNELIKILEAAPDADDSSVSFLVMAITDGEDNASKINGATLGSKIRALQASDRWTFVFRVPVGNKSALVRLGIPAGNIQEWEAGDEESLRGSTVQNMSAVSNYFTARTRGIGGTDKFYADLSSVSAAQVKQVMTNISAEVSIYHVHQSDDGSAIKDFYELASNKPYQLGTAFYELTKPEKAVQSQKLIVIRNQRTGAVYAGQSARALLGLPTAGTVKLVPGNHGDFDIFIQSTSVNRKLVGGTRMLYWGNATRSR